MKHQSITVHAPATVSNLCCGFDILGMALEEPFDKIRIEHSEQPGILIRHTDAYNLPLDPQLNIAGVALDAMNKALGIGSGFRVEIHKGIKPGSGIGSSAASAAGIVVAANELLGKPFSKTELLKYAIEGEVLASGSRHADNLAPCIFGGLVLVRDTASFDIIALKTAPVFISIVHPQIEIKTSYARQLLPKEIPLSVAVTQWANVAGLVAGFSNGDYGLISRSLHDEVAEPVRSKLIPGFSEVKSASMAGGALGGGISGSGPSIFMLSETRQIAEAVSRRMNAVFNALGIENFAYVSSINTEGVKIVESD